MGLVKPQSAIVGRLGEDGDRWLGDSHGPARLLEGLPQAVARVRTMIVPRSNTLSIRAARFADDVLDRDGNYPSNELVSFREARRAYTR